VKHFLLFNLATKYPMVTSIIPKLPFIDKHITLDFYVHQLGCTLVSDYGDYIIILLDAAELHFFSFPSLMPEKSDFMVYLRVDNGIDGYYERFSKNGAAFAKFGRLEVKPWGQKEFALLDPNGTLLTFGEAL